LKHPNGRLLFPADTWDRVQATPAKHRPKGADGRFVRPDEPIPARKKKRAAKRKGAGA
jgi:hypothetical protein